MPFVSNRPLGYELTFSGPGGELVKEPLDSPTAVQWRPGRRLHHIPVVSARGFGDRNNGAARPVKMITQAMANVGSGSKIRALPGLGSECQSPDGDSHAVPLTRW